MHSKIEALDEELAKRQAENGIQFEDPKKDDLSYIDNFGGSVKPLQAFGDLKDAMTYVTPECPPCGLGDQLMPVILSILIFILLLVLIIASDSITTFFKRSWQVVVAKIKTKNNNQLQLMGQNYDDVRPPSTYEEDDLNIKFGVKVKVGGQNIYDDKFKNG